MKRKKLVHVVYAAWVLFVLASSGFADALDVLRPELGAFAMQVGQALEGERTPVVAVIPFADDFKGVTQLGRLAAEVLEGGVAELPNVKVTDRSNLDAVMREKKAWLTDLFESRDPAKRAETAKILKADFLVLGTVRPAGKDVQFSVRLVETVSATLRPGGSKTFTIPRGETVDELLRRYVQRPEGKVEGTVEVPPMEVSFLVRAQEPTPDGKAREFTLADGGTLRSRDQFQVQFSPTSDCWVYVFILSSTGKCDTLFPYRGVKMGNFCRGGVRYALPDPNLAGESRWFWLDDNPGVETLYIVASYEEMKDIGRVLAEMKRAQDTGAAAREDLLDAVEKIRKWGRDESATASGVSVRNPRTPAHDTPAQAGEVLRGWFAAVKEFRIVHK